MDENDVLGGQTGIALDTELCSIGIYAGDIMLEEGEAASALPRVGITGGETTGSWVGRSASVVTLSRQHHIVAGKVSPVRQQGRRACFLCVDNKAREREKLQNLRRVLLYSIATREQSASPGACNAWMSTTTPKQVPSEINAINICTYALLRGMGRSGGVSGYVSTTGLKRGSRTQYCIMVTRLDKADTHGGCEYSKYSET
jgi:hypothetical protein